MIKGKVVNIKEGKEKLQNLEVILEEVVYGDFDEENPNAYYEEAKFEQQVFADIAGYQVNGDLLGITKKDGGNIVIPMRRIRIIETSFTEKE